MQRVSIGSRLLRRWMLLVAVLVVGIAGFAVYRLNGIFGSHDVTSTPSGAANEIVPFNPKHVVMEVFGPPGTVATQPAVFVNVSAQGDSDSIGCRIKIDNVVKDERTVNTLNAFTYCLDKSG